MEAGGAETRKSAAFAEQAVEYAGKASGRRTRELTQHVAFTGLMPEAIPRLHAGMSPEVPTKQLPGGRAAVRPPAQDNMYPLSR